jgi:hypothetical protein
MADPTATTELRAPTAQPVEDDQAFLDRIDALRVLRADSPEEKGRLLEEIGGSGRVEQDIVSELSKIRPLWRPDRFDEAHRMAMRSLEVLDRNGARQARLPRLGPLKPVTSYLVQFVTRWIVKGHQNRLISNIRKLYERREANSVWGSPEHVSLRRARIEATRVEAGLRGNPIGLPAFLLTGAFLSGLASGLQGFARSAVSTPAGVALTGLAIVLVLVALAWIALFAAGVARRRIRLSTDQPMRALWDTIGAAGNPPKDESYNFAAYAIALSVLAWIVIPLVVWLLFRGSTDVSGTANIAP